MFDERDFWQFIFDHVHDIDIDGEDDVHTHMLGSIQYDLYWK